MPADTTDKQNPAIREVSQRRFVVLHHVDHPHEADHYDLMIEDGDALATWRVAAPPEKTETRVSLVRLAPHRIAYLTYEGPVSNQRGLVSQHDLGTCTVQRINADWQIDFDGRLLIGMWMIRTDEKAKVFYLERASRG